MIIDNVGRFALILNAYAQPHDVGSDSENLLRRTYTFVERM